MMLAITAIIEAVFIVSTKLSGCVHAGYHFILAKGSMSVCIIWNGSYWDT